jgi:hypothetical protein
MRLLMDSQVKAELEAVQDSDGAGLPKEAIVASQRWLAGQLLEAYEIIDAHHDDFRQVKNLVRQAIDGVVPPLWAVHEIDKIVR